MENPRISVIGAGYVGLITGLVFSKKGYSTVCIDVVREKVDMINRGQPPFYEPGLEDLLGEEVKSGRLSASMDSLGSIRDSDITFICVGTPSLQDGSADLTYVQGAAKEIGLAIKEKDAYHVVAAKSTIPPGTTEEIILPVVEEYSGKRAGVDFGLCMNPEFLQQGSAIKNAFNPDRIVIGEYDARSGDSLEKLYSSFDCPKMRCGIKAAEMIKYAANSLLATKISFANEFARICEKFHVDVYEVMKGVGMDYRINPRFLNAGCGFGGSCFPKDVKAIISIANTVGVETPLLDSVIETNELQPLHLVEIVKETVGELEGKVAAFLGLSFKPDTDDVRETRALPIIEGLLEAGARVKAYDPEASANFSKITRLPIEYACSWREALEGSDFAVIHTDWEEIKRITPEDFKKYLKNPIVVDGRRTYSAEEIVSKGVTYRAIGWKNI